MLSIIICTTHEERANRLKQNIIETTVLENEVIVYVNQDNNGLCAVYNTCAQMAIYENLVFVHDDTLFHTSGWDEKIGTHLQRADIGVIGIMGGRYKSAFGVSWRDGESDFYRMQVLDGAEGGKTLCLNPRNVLFDEVVCLDGAFLCSTKAVWKQFPFDEKSFKGFHFYDLDWSLKIHLAGLKNMVVFDIQLEHFSQGNRSRALLNDFLIYQNKWGNHLPATLEDLQQTKVSGYEGYALAETLQLMKENGFTKKARWHQLKNYVRLHKNWYHTFRCLYFGFLK